MSYVNSVLQPGERVVVQGRLHWIVYAFTIALLVAGLAILAWEWALRANAVLIQVTAVVFVVLVAAAFGHAWFVRWITEIAVTDRRIIYKRGFITRHTAEMNMDKVSSVDVDQSILGRLLDYGTIHVIGAGGAAAGSSGTDARARASAPRGAAAGATQRHHCQVRKIAAGRSELAGDRAINAPPASARYAGSSAR